MSTPSDDARGWLNADENPRELPPEERDPPPEDDEPSVEGAPGGESATLPKAESPAPSAAVVVKRPGFEKICHNCKQPGHTRKECTEPNICGKCGSLEHTSRFCAWQKLHCCYCGKKGHAPQYCWGREGIQLHLAGGEGLVRPAAGSGAVPNPGGEQVFVGGAYDAVCYPAAANFPQEAATASVGQGLYWQPGTAPWLWSGDANWQQASSSSNQAAPQPYVQQQEQYPSGIQTPDLWAAPAWGPSQGQPALAPAASFPEPTLTAPEGLPLVHYGPYSDQDSRNAPSASTESAMRTPEEMMIATAASQAPPPSLREALEELFRRTQQMQRGPGGSGEFDLVD